MISSSEDALDNVDQDMALFGHPRLLGWAAAFELIPAYFAYISENVSDVSRSFKKNFAHRERKKTHKCVFTLEIPIKFLRFARKNTSWSISRVN